MYNLQVTIDPLSGFCFGVVYAIEMAEEFLKENETLYCLGDIVHNDMEVDRLTNMGLTIISHDELKALRNAKVLIRAHGEPPETYRIALENDIELIDASCPVVLKLQNRIRQSYEKGENILIYGKKDHAEVIGLHGQTQNTAIVFEDSTALEFKELPSEVTLYSQTTKNKQTFERITRDLNSQGVKVNAHDTICRQVSNRDEELRRFAAEHDRIVFVSGRKSSNGQTLFKICKEVNTGSHFVSNPYEIEIGWFTPNDTVGICGATSTPQWLMQAVREKLLSL